MKARHHISICLFVVALMAAIVLLGCASGDANALKMIFGGESEPKVTRAHTENIQKFAREGAQEAEAAKQQAEAATTEAAIAASEARAAKEVSEQSDSKLDKIIRIVDKSLVWGERIAYFTAVALPTLGGLAASLKVVRSRQKKMASKGGRRASDAKGGV